MDLRRGLLWAGSALSLPTAVFAQSIPVPKTNPMKVYAHLMPWFQTPYTLGTNNWGYHWKFNTRNPNVIDPTTGQRQIASNYYPLTGPYDSTDPNIIEYQMLLMKLSGIDGVMVDWYGQNGTNGDINSLLTASNTIVNKTSTYGLQFAAVLEDRFASSTGDVSTNISYLRSNYFNKSNYIRLGAGNSPLMPIFGPVQYQQSSQWNTIMAGSPGEHIDAVPLWYQSSQLGSNAGGEFSWIWETAGTNDHLTQQQNFLTIRSPQLKGANSAATVIGAAYPGFNDYYQAGGTGTVIPFNPIPSNNGQTLASVLAVDAANASHMDMLQLDTWNDYGEGTMFEPTVQTGFSYLQQVQQFTGVPYGLTELQMVYQLYEERVAYAGNSGAQSTLNTASSALNQLDFAGAGAALNQLQNVTWTGNASNTHWSSGSNWSFSTVVPTNILTFSGTQGLSTSNDFPVQSQFNGFVFAANAGSFLLAGNAVNFYGDIVNNSNAIQTISLPLVLQKTVNINTPVGDVSISGVISGVGGVAKAGAGLAVLSGANSYTGPTIVNGGTLRLLSNLTASSSLTIAGGSLQLASNGTATRVIVTPSLSISAGTLDLADNKLIVRSTAPGTWNGSSYTGMAGLIQSGRGDGTWNGGTGIVTSQSNATQNTFASIGIATAQQARNLPSSTATVVWNGQTVQGSDTLVMYTYGGDATLDGKINIDDYIKIDNGIANGLAGWINGDFNYDGRVNIDDYTQYIDANIRTQGAPFSTAGGIGSSAVVVTPEPASVALGAMSVVMAIMPRRRRRISIAGKYDDYV